MWSMKIDIPVILIVDSSATIEFYASAAREDPARLDEGSYPADAVQLTRCTQR